MKLLVSKGVTNVVGKTLDVSWKEFCDLMRSYSSARSDESSTEKKSSVWFSASEYQKGLRRRENIIGRPWAVVVDLDEIHDPKAVEKALSRWEYFAWTTWNSTPEGPRWRIVLPIDGGIEPERFGSLVDKVLSPIGKAAKVDTRSRFPEQCWFAPQFKESQRRNHRIWHHGGSWIKEGQLIHVDFTGVKLARKPEEVEEGARNETLVIRLTESDALRCASRDELREIADDWNARLKKPMSSKEVLSVVKKKWNWMQRGEGLIRRAEAWKGRLEDIELLQIGSGVSSDDMRSATLPPSIVGDFLYPGATMISAKMKEGKSFIAMQLALSIATGTQFLEGTNHPGFQVKRKKKAVIIAGEDTAGGISHRFLGSMAAGHLPEPLAPEDVLVVFNDDLDRVRETQSRVPGLALFEALVRQWYERGYRVICLDPLRVVEAALGIDDYPGTTRNMNAHTRDFLVMRYYTKVAQEYDDLCLLISMHHGKNKRDHDAADPGDMIAGTTGYGAGAIGTISLLPIPEQLEAQEDGSGRTAKRRVLYLHGRYTKEQRYLIEQSATTGVWACIGELGDEMVSLDRQRYFDTMIELGASAKWISAEAIAKAAKRHVNSVRKVLARVQRGRELYMGYRLIAKRGEHGGYRLIGRSGYKVSSEEEST